jgi:hypothetical protein
MRSKVVVWVLLALLILGIAIFRYRTMGTLHVDPHAAGEIEKAKQR